MHDSSLLARMNPPNTSVSQANIHYYPCSDKDAQNPDSLSEAGLNICSLFMTPNHAIKRKAITVAQPWERCKRA